jgi:uncharacterized phage infection (PIP) family protein YhgE
VTFYSKYTSALTFSKKITGEKADGRAKAPAQYTPSVEELQGELRAALDHLGALKEELVTSQQLQTTLQGLVTAAEASRSTAENR